MRLLSPLLVVALATASLPAQDQRTFTQKPEIAEAASNAPAGESDAEAVPVSTSKIDFSKGPETDWIWGKNPTGNDDRFVFRKEFAGGTQAADLIASCDNEMTIFINGKQVAASTEWQTPVTVNVQKFVRQGPNEIVVHGRNAGGQAGLAVKLQLVRSDGKLDYVVTDKTWQVALKKDADKWAAAVSLGKMGMAPWNNVFANPGGGGSGLVSKTPRGVFNVLPGFQVELLYSVPKNELGSWVCIAFDPQGRLIASDQGNRGLCRITVPKIGSDEETKVERLDVKLSGAQGMLHAFGSLYVSVNGGPGSGFYRARDTNSDDQYDDLVKLKAFQGGGEHGPHSVRLSPDGKSLFVIAGNHTNPPADFDASRPPANWSEDLLLPRQWDARGHARGKLAPGGWIAQTDPDGKAWEIYSIGYRNPFDMDFNADGELFAYDADMEWDMGTPWYRPTRVNHAVSGSEFGWRSGTGKWPTWYADSLPEVVDIGPGSPVGVTFGYGSKFPAKYQKALYLLDWTFGTIYAIHLTPQGASYVGQREEFLSRLPLPLTDATVGPDGSLYFTIGGRGTQSALYRVTYVGDESTAPANAKDRQFADLRASRKQLEAFHVKPDPRAIDAAWPFLGHADRHLRYAARIALEHQDAATWQDKALAEKNPTARINALIGLARQGSRSLQGKILDSLGEITFKSLDETTQLELLRAYALTFTRMGQPDVRVAAEVASRLEPSFPSSSIPLNRELSRVLVYLNSSKVIEPTLALMKKDFEPSAEDISQLLARNPGYGGTIAKMLANKPEIEKIHFALVLRNMRYGWTLDQRREYFAWFTSALSRSGGASYQGFINNIRKEAMANLSEAEALALESTTIAPPPKPSELPKPKGPGRKWAASDVVKLADSGLSGRDFDNGKLMFAAAKCASCHRFDGAGGATGPDLTSVAGRFSLKDLSDSLVEPSKVISDQYRASIITTEGGKVINGRIVGEEDGKLKVMTDAFDATKVVEVDKDDVDQLLVNKVSLMPTGLLDALSQDEVLDLIAYMLSRGNPNDVVFAK